MTGSVLDVNGLVINMKGLEKAWNRLEKAGIWWNMLEWALISWNGWNMLELARIGSLKLPW